MTRRHRRSAGGKSDRRAQSEVVGVVLLLGLTLVGAGVVVVYGANAIQSTTDSADLSRAEHAMTQLDSKASLVAHGSSDTQQVSVAGQRRGTVYVDEDAGWMRVTNDSVGGDTILMNETMGMVVYRRGESTVAYQGGGVWRKEPAGSSMVSPPEFHYQGRTLTLPLVLVRDSNGTTAGGTVRINRGGDPVGKFPTDDPGRSNPLTEGEIHVTVKSEYYEAWGRFFEQRTGGNATVDHDNGTATVELVIPEEQNRVAGAITATATGDEIDLQGGGVNDAFVDSYNSTVDDYAGSKQKNGTVVTAGDVTLSGNSNISGNVRSGGTVALDANSATLTGTAYWTTGFEPGGTYGGEEQIDGVTSPDSSGPVTREKVDDLSDDNDNGGAPISGSDPRLDYGADDTVTLSNGDYYLNKINAKDKTINFDTNGGTVTVGIENSVDIEDVDIDVQDGGVVRLYVKDDVDVQDDVNVSVPGDVASQFWVYGTKGTDVDIQASQGNPTRIVGVFYAPGGGGGDTSASIRHADVYGGVVAGDVDVETGGAVHYDEALEDENPFPPGTNVPRVTFLHVSVNRVNVTA